MANTSPETAQPNETQRAETIANRFYDMANKARAEEAQYPQEERFKEEMFSGVRRETLQGNFHGAQRLLERSGIWNDDLRGAVSEVNRLDQEKRGAKPMSLEDVQKTIGEYARDFEKMSEEKGERQANTEGAMALDNIASDISEPGIEEVDNALKYIEGALASTNHIADNILKSVSLPPEDKAAFLKDWQDKRAIRDALFQEKQKRVEQMKQSQRDTEELTKERGATATRLERAFTQAGIPEDAASRKEFLGRAGTMSAEELHFLDSALNKAAREAMRSGDPKRLEGLLMDLGTKSFKRKDVEVRQSAEDQRKIEETRRSLNAPEQQAKPTRKAETSREGAGWHEVLEHGVAPTETAKIPGAEETTARKKQLDDFVKRQREQAAVASPTERVPKTPEQRQEKTSPFERYYNSPGLTEILNERTRSYTSEKGTSALLKVFSEMFPNANQFAAKLDKLVKDRRVNIEEYKRQKPDVTDEGAEAYANKEVIKGLSEPERRKILYFINANPEKIWGQSEVGMGRSLSFEMEFSDLMTFLSERKNKTDYVLITRSNLVILNKTLCLWTPGVHNVHKILQLHFTLVK